MKPRRKPAFVCCGHALTRTAIVKGMAHTICLSCSHKWLELPLVPNEVY